MGSSPHVDLSRMERGLAHVKVWQHVYADQQHEMLPVLYSIGRENDRLVLRRFNALVQYLFDNSARSPEWMLDCVRTVGNLIDYTVAWLPLLKAMQKRGRLDTALLGLLRRFVRALVKGTGVVKGGHVVDRLGLYWSPRPESSVKISLSRLMTFLRDLPNESERDEHPTFPFAIAAARTAPSPIGAERDGRRSR